MTISPLPTPSAGTRATPPDGRATGVAPDRRTDAFADLVASLLDPTTTPGTGAAVLDRDGAGEPHPALPGDLLDLLDASAPADARGDSEPVSSEEPVAAGDSDDDSSTVDVSQVPAGLLVPPDLRTVPAAFPGLAGLVAPSPQPTGSPVAVTTVTPEADAAAASRTSLQDAVATPAGGAGTAAGPAPGVRAVSPIPGAPTAPVAPTPAAGPTPVDQAPPTPTNALTGASGVAVAPGRLDAGTPAHGAATGRPALATSSATRTPQHRSAEAPRGPAAGPAAGPTAGPTPGPTPDPTPGPTPGPTDALGAPLAAVAPVAAPPTLSAVSPASPDSTTAHAVARQVAVEVLRLAESGPRHDTTRHVTLQLNPAALGEVRVTLSMRGGTVRVRLAAASGVTREALADGVPELRRLLAEHATPSPSGGRAGRLDSGEVGIVVADLPRDHAARSEGSRAAETAPGLPGDVGAQLGHSPDGSASGAPGRDVPRPARMPVGPTATDGSRPAAHLPSVDDQPPSSPSGRLDVSV